MNLFKKKNQEPIYQEQYLYKDAVDYRIYKMSASQRTTSIIIGFIIGALCGYAFFTLIVFAIIGGVIGAIIFQKAMIKRGIAKRNKQLLSEFRDFLENMDASIKSGSNVQDAVEASYLDLSKMYNDKSFIVPELNTMIVGMRNGIPLEESFKDFGKRSGSDDIISFASVFETSYQIGGNMSEVISSTYDVLNDKITIGMEVNTIIAGSKSELYVMMCMPVVFSLIMNTSGLIGTDDPVNKIIPNIIAIVLFLVAYAVGNKIMEVKL